MSKKFVYLFAEGNESMRELLGGKGANLAEMSNLGMPVPYGFTITTEACNQYYDDGEIINADIRSEIEEYLGKLEEQAQKKFGDTENPLLVSVRSGARASMPGMMDTILNLGMNDEVVEGVAQLTGNPRFAYDSYRRFIQMYADVVMGLNKSRFEEIIDEIKKEKGVYVVKSSKLEKVIKSTNFDDYESLNYFQNAITTSGLTDALKNAGIKPGDSVSVNGVEFEFFE